MSHIYKKKIIIKGVLHLSYIITTSDPKLIIINLYKLNYDYFAYKIRGKKIYSIKKLNHLNL
jgi:hypothetical protein